MSEKVWGENADKYREFRNPLSHFRDIISSARDPNFKYNERHVATPEQFLEIDAFFEASLDILDSEWVKDRDTLLKKINQVEKNQREEALRASRRAR